MLPAYASTEKRGELVRAATVLLHRQGLERTTLADVAAHAKVPLGNVYYYFKTKDALAEAVIASHETSLRERLAFWEARHADPRARLRALIRAPLDAAESIVHFGCPHGSLCQELEKLGPDAPLARAAARLLGVYVDWVEVQLRAGGVRRNARERALDLVASLQGTMLLAHTLRSPDLLARQLRRLERSLDDAASLSSRSRS